MNTDPLNMSLPSNGSTLAQDSVNTLPEEDVLNWFGFLHEPPDTESRADIERVAIVWYGNRWLIRTRAALLHLVLYLGTVGVASGPRLPVSGVTWTIPAVDERRVSPLPASTM